MCAAKVYASSTKDSGVIGLPGLAEVCAAAAPVPVVAIGGIQTANALEPLRAGAVGVAVVSETVGTAAAAGAEGLGSVRHWIGLGCIRHCIGRHLGMSFEVIGQGGSRLTFEVCLVCKLGGEQVVDHNVGQE
eukprot:scaffold309163_cov17-Tisochrysis_lutea.AAC.1